MTKPRIVRWLTHQRIPAGALRFNDLQRETRWLLWFAGFYILAAAATGLLIRFFPMPLWGAAYFTQDTWYVLGFKIILLLTLPLVVYRRWGYKLTDLLCQTPRITDHDPVKSGEVKIPRRILTHLRAPIVIALCFALGYYINAGRIAELKDAYAMHTPAVAFARAALGAVLAWVMAGIPEEVVYRGMLQTRLEAVWGRIPAILMTVVLFTAWHIPTRFLLSAGVEGEAGDIISVLIGTGAPVAIVALILSWAWDRWRDLPAMIALHAGIDTIPIICSMLQSTAESYR